MRSASILVKPASGLCNMHCDYCFYRDEMARRAAGSHGMMSPDTLKALIRRTLPQTTHQYSIAFQGGEPTLRGIDFYRGAVDMLRRYNRNGAQITLGLQTNGLLLDEAWAGFLAENHILAGLSADGTAALHDAHRHLPEGGSAFAAVSRAAKLLDQYGVSYNILTVVHRETAAHVREIYRAFQQRGWRYLQFITCLDPLGAPRGRGAFSLTPEVYGQFLIDLFDLWYADARRGKAPFIRQFDNWLSILAGYSPEACEHCGVCGVQYVVEADGSVYPCDFYAVDEWLLGNIAENTLAELDARREALGFCRRSRHIPAGCRECPHRSLCRNGCRRSRVEEADDLNYFCPAYRRFFDACGSRLADLAKQYGGK